MFATKPQLAEGLLDRARGLGIRAAVVAGVEVYGGRQLCRGICQRGMSYVMAVRANLISEVDGTWMRHRRHESRETRPEHEPIGAEQCPRETFSCAMQVEISSTMLVH